MRMCNKYASCQGNLPCTGGLRAILNYLTDNIEHENCAAACLAWVAENACRAGADVPDLLPLHVWRAILVHNENSLVAEHALAILAHCTVVGKMHLEDAKSTASMGPNETTFLETLIDNSTYWNANTFQMIYDLIEKHSSVDRVLGNGFALLDAVFCPPGHISFQRNVENAFWEKHGKLCQKLCEMGFVDLILGALRKVQEGISELLRPALSVLWKLSVDRKNAKSFIGKGAFVAVYDAMKAYPQHIGILNQAALCISALASETALTEEALTDLDVSALLLTMVENFLSYPDLCHNALLAMSTILHRSEKQALHFIHCVNMDNESKAIKCLDDIYRTHFDNLTIIEAVCSVADAMLSYDGIVEALVGELDKIKRLLKEIFNRFPVIHGIGDVCASALRKIPAEYWQDEPISSGTSVTTDS
ncbi:JUN phosphorylation [Sparganum proliferum]